MSESEHLIFAETNCTLELQRVRDFSRRIVHIPVVFVPVLLIDGQNYFPLVWLCLNELKEFRVKNFLERI